MKIKIVMALLGLSILMVACGANGSNSAKPDASMEENADISKEERTVNSEEEKEQEDKKDESEEVKKDELEETEEDEPEEEKEDESEEVEEDEPQEENESKLTAAELEEVLLQQPCYVEKIDYMDGDYGIGADVSVIVKNNSGTDIKDVFYAMAGWDGNNLPLILYTYKPEDGTGYVVETHFGDANIVDGGTYGEGLLFGIKEQTASRLETFKAVVVKYEDFEGNTWENPYYSDWIEMYKEKKLEL